MKAPRGCLPAALLAFLLTPQGAAQASPAAPRHTTVTVSASRLLSPPTLDRPPPGYRMSANEAIAIASRLSKVIAVRRGRRPTYANAYERGISDWQVSFFRDPGRREIAQVYIADRSRKVTETWTGIQVAWTMARGYPGAFGRKVNALYVWLPLCLLFVLPFLRRPVRMLHLDLLMLCAFSVSLAFFNRAQIEASVPLSYPPLIYLLARMLWIGMRRSQPASPPPIRLLVPTSWLAVGLVFLVGFRVGLNVTDSNVIDVGYASVVGAHQISQGKAVYGHFPSDVAQGDTYGPTTYGAYVPFTEVFGFSGRWDDLPAAHGAAITFDLICIALLILIGRRLRGPPLGWLLGYAWAAYPFTLFALDSNSNDSLAAALVLGAVLLAGSAPARGALGALAGLAKFAPLALAPLLATHALGRRRLRHLAGFGAAFAAAGAVALEPALAHGGSLHTFYERTIGYQAGRGSPFSVWGLYGGLGWLQAAVQILAVALAVLLALVPRRPDTVGLAALAAAILILLQLGITHWFYLYIVWFFPLVAIALLASAPLASPSTAPAAAQSTPRASPERRSAPALP